MSTCHQTDTHYDACPCVQERRESEIREACARIAEAWAENFPEDVFLPVTAPYTVENNSYDRIAAHASRHAAKMIAANIREENRDA